MCKAVHTFRWLLSLASVDAEVEQIAGRWVCTTPHLYSPWCRLGLHVLLEEKPPIKLEHCLIYADGTARLVLGRTAL